MRSTRSGGFVLLLCAAACISADDKRADAKQPQVKGAAQSVPKGDKPAQPAGEKKRAVAPIDTAKLLGKWLANDEGEPIVVEFCADGTLTLTYKDGSKDDPSPFTYAVGGDKLVVMATVFGEDVYNKLTIIKLTDTELVTKHADGTVEKKVRIKDK